MSNQAVISVIVPAYNSEKYIKRCLDSLGRQTYSGFEAVIIDDGSTDQTLRIVKDYTRNDERYKVFHQMNMGLSDARNTGIDNSNGKYIIFLDSDDELEIDALGKIIELLEKWDLDMLLFDALAFDQDGSIADQSRQSAYNRGEITRKVISGEQMFVELMKKNSYIECAVLYAAKRSLYMDNHFRFYPKLIHEDCLFTSQVYYTASRVMYRNLKLYRRYFNDGSIMQSRTPESEFRNYAIVLLEYLNFFYGKKIALSALGWYKEYAMSLYYRTVNNYEQMNDKSEADHRLREKVDQQIDSHRCRPSIMWKVKRRVERIFLGK